MSRPRRPGRPRRKVDPARISALCQAGRHDQCHGTVYLIPPVDGKRFIACECPVKNCGHGRRDR